MIIHEHQSPPTPVVISIPKDGSKKTKGQDKGK